MKKRIVIVVILLILLVAGYLVWHALFTRQEMVLYGNVDIRTVNSSFRVDGRLLTLTKEEGDPVKRGELLATLDAEPYQIVQNRAEANLMAQQAQLDLVTRGYRSEAIAQATAQVAQYQAAYQYAEANYQRQNQLIKRAAISKDQLDNSLTARDQASATLQAAKDNLLQLTNGYRVEEIEQAQANVALAKAGVAEAQLNVTDSELYSPCDGTILTRAVEAGTLLSAGSPVYAISLDSPVWIRAYIDEVNLAKAVPGTTVYIYTDGRPNKPYMGQIGFVSPTAEFTPKTVETAVLRTDLVYRLRIQVATTGEGQADEMLRMGMPVTLKFTPDTDK